MLQNKKNVLNQKEEQKTRAKSTEIFDTPNDNKTSSKEEVIIKFHPRKKQEKRNFN